MSSAKDTAAKAAADAKALAALNLATRNKIMRSANAKGIQFNLPPCDTSLPLSIGEQGLLTGGGKANKPDMTRLSAMWFLNQTGASLPATKGATSGQKAGAADTNFNYGFQWLWNPQQVGSSVQQNTTVVANPMDATSAQNGLFPGLETVTVQARINRVVDMAIIRGGGTPVYTTSGGRSYGLRGPQLKLLTEKGTMADIEHIYRMCNGVLDGAGKPHTNVFGIETSDTAYLTPTTIALKIGTGPLVYSGWLQAMTIAHTMFTWDMVPIDTTIDFTINTFALTAFAS
jgi:hypothetical protein